jgi:DNA polymerase IIIc chi subunit
MADEDIDFIRNNTIIDNKGKVLDADSYEATKNSTDIDDVISHRTSQELLRDKYKHYSNQNSWNINNEILHNYINNKFMKK